VGTSNLKIRYGIELSKTREIQRFVNMLAPCMMGKQKLQASKVQKCK